MTPNRITAIANGTRVPLFASDPLGMLSPSQSLLIETHATHAGTFSTRVINEQVLTLFLNDGLVEHGIEERGTNCIAVPAGAVVLSLRERRETIQWMKPARVMSVRLHDRVLAEAASTLGRPGNRGVAPSSGVRDAQLTALLQALYFEQTNGFTAGRLYLDGLEQALAALLVSRHAQCPAWSGAHRGGLHPAIARRVEEFVRANLAHPITLAELAGCAGYSASHFSRLCRCSFGMTPHRYVQRVRIEQAMKLLAKPHRSMLDIALDCGFQTQQHFSRVFHATVGVSPGEFKRTR